MSENRSGGRARPADRDDEAPRRRQAGPKKWGGVARRGAARIAGDDPDDSDRAAERERDRARDRHESGDRNRPEPRWERDDRPKKRAGGEAPTRGRSEDRPTFRLPDGDYERFVRAISGSAPARGGKAGGRSGDKAKRELRQLNEAAQAFEAERFDDARKLLAPLVDRAPDVPSLRELLGLTYYRLEKWPDAVEQLEALRALSQDCSQHPVLADSYRALGDHDRVDELWVELAETSPSAELVTEGRIVTAGSKADRGDLRGAIKMVGAKGWTIPKRPQEHHLRRAYALADLRERAGDVPAARDLFARLAQGGGFADAEDRLEALE